MHFFNEGVNLAKVGRHADAIDSYDKAIAIDPNHADAVKKRKIAQYRLNDHLKRIRLHDKEDAINPNDAANDEPGKTGSL